LVRDSKYFVPWPNDNRVYRGGALPEKCIDFFRIGLSYRVPMFLATSKDRLMAEKFSKFRSQTYQHPAVLFVFYFDPVEKCSHANYIKASQFSEEEFLFVPYSGFKIKDIVRGTGILEIHIDVAADNKGEDVTEDATLAPWH